MSLFYKAAIISQTITTMYIKSLIFIIFLIICNAQSEIVSPKDDKIDKTVLKNVLDVVQGLNTTDK